jgi:hypothetical protein
MITAFWWDVDNAVKTTIKQHITTEVRGIKFFYKSGMLFIRLPSGRDKRLTEKQRSPVSCQRPLHLFILLDKL